MRASLCHPASSKQAQNNSSPLFCLTSALDDQGIFFRIDSNTIHYRLGQSYPPLLYRFYRVNLSRLARLSHRSWGALVQDLSTDVTALVTVGGSGSVQEDGLGCLCGNAELLTNTTKRGGRNRLPSCAICEILVMGSGQLLNYMIACTSQQAADLRHSRHSPTTLARYYGVSD